MFQAQLLLCWLAQSVLFVCMYVCLYVCMYMHTYTYIQNANANWSRALDRARMPVH